MKTIFITISVFLVVAIFVMSLKNIKLEEQKDAMLKVNPHWEMVKNDCGRDDKKDLANDYCRGFHDGYDYAFDMKKIDEQLQKIKDAYNN